MSWKISQSTLITQLNLISPSIINGALFILLSDTNTPHNKAVAHGLPYPAPLTPFPKRVEPQNEKEERKRAGRCDLWFGILVPFFRNAKNLWSFGVFPWFAEVYLILWQRFVVAWHFEKLCGHTVSMSESVATCLLADKVRAYYSLSTVWFRQRQNPTQPWHLRQTKEKS
jgi:hypothetical protein